MEEVKSPTTEEKKVDMPAAEVVEETVIDVKPEEVKPAPKKSDTTKDLLFGVFLGLMLGMVFWAITLIIDFYTESKEYNTAMDKILNYEPEEKSNSIIGELEALQEKTEDGKTKYYVIISGKSITVSSKQYEDLYGEIGKIVKYSEEVVITSPNTAVTYVTVEVLQ